MFTPTQMRSTPMHAFMMPMTVPLSAGKFLVQVMRTVVSMKVPARGATIEMPTTCQYDGWIHLLHSKPVLLAGQLRQYCSAAAKFMLMPPAEMVVHPWGIVA